jgi:hypothetical protein
MSVLSDLEANSSFPNALFRLNDLNAQISRTPPSTNTGNPSPHLTTGEMGTCHGNLNIVVNPDERATYTAENATMNNQIGGSFFWYAEFIQDTP